MNGRTSFELKPRKAEEEIVELVGRLEGVDRFSMILWRLPEGVPFLHVDVNDYPHEYMQCAGSFAGRLTAEVREIDDGEPHQYVLGRPLDEGEGEGEDTEADEVVPWGENEAHVRPNEVLTGSEVTELFLAYYRTGGEVPSSYARRLLQV